MHRTDAANHVANMFVDGNPAIPSVGTTVDDDWLNAVQEEIAGVIEGAGITLVKGTNNQLAAAVVLAGGSVAQNITGVKTFTSAGQVVLSATTNTRIESTTSSTTGTDAAVKGTATNVGTGVWGRATGTGASSGVGVAAEAAGSAAALIAQNTGSGPAATFIGPVDMSQGPIKASGSGGSGNAPLRFTPQASSPAGVEGALYYDSAAHMLYFHNGTNWTAVA